MYEKRRASGGRLWVAAICALVLCGCAETRVGGPKCQPDASSGQRCGSGDVRHAASAREDSGPEGGAGAAGSAATAADARAPEDADAGPNPATDAATDAAVDASADASPPPFLPCDTEDARLCTIDFPPGTDRLEPSDVSADASTVAGTAWIARVGSTIVGPPFYAWTWTLAARTTTLTVAPQIAFPTRESDAVAVSADGSVVLWRGDSHAELRPAGAAAVPLPFDSVADMSDDGTVVVGGDREAVRWTQAAGIERLGFLEPPLCDLPCGEISAARAVSGDGLVVVGESTQQAFRWSQSDGLQRIPVPHDFNVTAAVATAADHDGTVIAGCIRASSSALAHWRFTAATGVQDLGSLEGEGESDCDVALTADGSVVVGQSQGKAFVWNPAQGMRELALVLVEAGLDLWGWEFERVGGISADGKVIAGRGTFMDRPIGFIARLP